MAKRTSFPMAIDERKTCSLSLPRDLTEHDIDPTAPKHPWDERYDDCNGLATCACCGTRVKRVIIVTSLQGEEFDLGLDCFRRHYDAKNIRKRLSASKKTREGWLEALNPARGDAPKVALRIEAGEIDLSDPENRNRWNGYCNRWERHIEQIEASGMTDSDRADVLTIWRSTLARWRRF